MILIDLQNKMINFNNNNDLSNVLTALELVILGK